jgi:hypothetical protein
VPGALAWVAVFGRVDAEHGRQGAGGAAGWLRALGIDELSLARLRERLVSR